MMEDATANQNRSEAKDVRYASVLSGRDNRKEVSRQEQEQEQEQEQARL